MRLPRTTRHWAAASLRPRTSHNMLFDPEFALVAVNLLLLIVWTVTTKPCLLCCRRSGRNSSLNITSGPHGRMLCISSPIPHWSVCASLHLHLLLLFFVIPAKSTCCWCYTSLSMLTSIWRPWINNTSDRWECGAQSYLACCLARACILMSTVGRRYSTTGATGWDRIGYGRVG